MIAKSAFPTIPDFSFRPIFVGSLCRDVDVLRGVQPDVCAVQRTLLEGKRGLVSGDLVLQEIVFAGKSTATTLLGGLPRGLSFFFLLMFLFWCTKTKLSFPCLVTISFFIHKSFVLL